LIAIEHALARRVKKAVNNQYSCFGLGNRCFPPKTPLLHGRDQPSTTTR
jgi:hypothetical protein